MASSRSLNVVVTSETRAFKRGMDDAGRSLEKFGKDADATHRKSSSAFGKIGGSAKAGFAAVAAGAGAAVVGLGALAKASVDAASDISESLSKNRVLFGQYAKDVEAFAKTSAAAFGISRRAALEYTGVFGNLSRAIGISKKDSAEMSVQLTKLAADLASFNNTSIEDALDALRSGLTGETEPLRRFGVTLSAVSVEAEAVRSGIVKLASDSTKVKTTALQLEDAEKKAAAALKEHGKESLEYRRAANAAEVAQDRFKAATKGTVPDLTAQQKALATVAQIMRQTKNAQGDAERTAGSYANQVKRLQARIDDLKVSLGERLLPTFTRIVTGANDLISAFSDTDRETRSLGRGLTQAQKAMGVYGDAADDGNSKTAQMKRTIDAVREQLSGYTSALGQVKSALDPYIDATKDVVAWTRRHKTIMGLLDASLQSPTDNLRVISGVLDGVAAAARAVKTAVEKVIETFKSTPAGGLFETAMGLFGDGLGKIGDGIGSIPAFGGGLMGARPSMAPVAGAASRFGLNVTSGLRPGSVTSSGNRSYHSTGEALDVAGTPAGMKGFFNFMKNKMGGRLAELIYTPGGTGIRNGAPHTYSGQVAADHFDHVHVAIDTGVPGVGDGLGKFSATAYGPPWGGIQGTGVTATGVNLKGSPHIYGVAVDPNVIPLGSKLKIWPNPFGYRGTFTAFDTGGAIKGKDIDFYDWRGRSAQLGWGTRSVNVELVTGGRGKSGSKGSKVREAPRGERDPYDPKSMYGPREPRTIAEYLAQRDGDLGPYGVPVKGATGPPKGISPNYEPPDLDLPTEGDFLDLALAEAEATPDTADDKVALGNILSFKERQLAGATDPRERASLIREITGLKQAINGLDDTLQRHTDLLAQNAANQLKIIALTETQGPAIIAALAAVLSGEVGGHLGLAFQTPGFAGGLANYAGGGTGRL